MCIRICGFHAWLFLAISACASAPAAASNGVVGPGNCNESGFNSVLSTVDNSGGGTITFNCGTATIPFTFYKQVAHALTIDGGGTITFDGGNASAFFQVHGSSTTTLKRLTLQHGVMSSSHALENFGVLTLDTVRMQNNSSISAAVYNQGTLIVSSSTFSGNANSSTGSEGDGGAIQVASGSVSIRTSTFTGNTAGRHGGAIANLGGDVRIQRSTFSGNHAPYGGAIYSTSTTKVDNATFTGNSAVTGGGAFYQEIAGDSVLTYLTVVGNSGVFGGGISNDSAHSNTLTVGRSLLVSNTGGNCDGVLLTAGYNLSNDTNCGGTGLNGPGDLNGQTLAMGALANNGGPTQTMLQQSGNPAINHVPNGLCMIPVDQRGAGRPSGPGCDSGAVEVGGTIDLILYDGFE